MNHRFASLDGKWQVNLTSKFLSLTCSGIIIGKNLQKCWTCPWRPFIQTYAPSCFERVGLRYLNFVSRRDLDLEGVPFRELFSPVIWASWPGGRRERGRHHPAAAWMWNWISPAAAREKSRRPRSGPPVAWDRKSNSCSTRTCPCPATCRCSTAPVRFHTPPCPVLPPFSVGRSRTDSTRPWSQSMNKGEKSICPIITTVSTGRISSWCCPA